MSNTGIVELHGKQYKTVALRVTEFRAEHPLWSLTAEVIDRDSDWVVMRAQVADETGRIIATGHAEENRKSSQINRTSALENCETSAIGRALAALGYGGSEFASADELANAIQQQKSPLKGPILPSDGAMESLSLERQALLRVVADKIIIDGNGGDIGKAVERLDRAAKELEFENEDKIALWTLLPSKIRTAIKKHQQDAKNEQNKV